MSLHIPDRINMRLARGKVTTDGSGNGTLLLKVPGTAGGLAQRVIEGGYGWFETPHRDDSFVIHITDEDDILGGGAGAVVGGFTDMDVPVANRGWYFPEPNPLVDLRSLGGKGRLMGGLYLRVKVNKGDDSVDTFRINVKWGREI